MKASVKQWLWRIFFYVLGGLTLAFGVSMQSRLELGVSPIISMAYVVSQIWQTNFAVTTCIVYVLLVGLQFILKGKKKDWRDLLQIPFSLVFSTFLQLFGTLFTDQLPLPTSSLAVNFLLLVIGVLFTAIGISMMVNMQLIPNPADGLAKTVGELLHKDMGFGKNTIDIISVSVSCLIGLIFAHQIIGIGLGTLFAMIGVGRVVSLFNHFCQAGMRRLAGFTDSYILRAAKQRKVI